MRAELWSCEQRQSTTVGKHRASVTTGFSRRTDGGSSAGLVIDRDDRCGPARADRRLLRAEMAFSSKRPTSNASLPLSRNIAYHV